MKKSIDLYNFRESFSDMGRDNNFTNNGLKYLFDYLCEYEEDCGQEIELDVVALCCEFTELEGIDELISQYNIDIDDEENKFEECLDYLQDRTSVIHFEEDDDCIVFAQF